MTPLRLLLVEDDEDAALLIEAELRRGGWEPEIVRVETEAALAEALPRGPWPLVISDLMMPGLSGMRALQLVHAAAPDTPFIMVSGAMSEAVAVDAMRAGAADYVMKDNLARLGPAVRRELVEADVRREKTVLAASLHESQARFRSIFEQAPVGMLVADGNRRWVDVNERFCRITGWTREELLAPQSRLYRDLVGFDAAELTSERAFVRRDGSSGWVAITVSPAHKAAGGIEHYVAMVEDITDRRQAVARLALQRHLLDSVQQAVIATDMQGVITYWSRFAEHLYGWPEGEVIGRHILDITPAGLSAAVSSEVLNRLARGESWSGEMTLQRRDGTLFTGWVTDAPITGPDGELLGLVGVSVDITEQKTAIDALRLREAQLAEAQEIANLGSWELDLRTGARMWSDQIFRMHGIEKGPPEIEKTMSLIHPDDREEIEAIFDHARRNGVPAEVEYRIIRPDGRIRTLQERGRVVHDEQGRPVKIVGYVQDVTERVAVERELTRRSDQQEAIADLSQMALAGTPSTELLAHAQKLVALGLERESDVLHAPAHAETLPPHDSHFIRSVANVLAEARERESARQELVASEARYRNVFEGASEIIFTVDPEGRITSLNPAFERVTGYALEEGIGQHFIELIDSADRERAILTFEQVKRGKRNFAEYSIVRADGRSATLEVSVAAKMENGRAVEIHGFARDVTDERIVEAESHRLTRDLQLLLESTDEGICTINLEGRVTLVNRSAAHLIGDSVEELMGARLHERIHPRCPGCAIESVLTGAPGQRVHEDVFLRAGVMRFPVEYAVAPIIDGGAVKGAVLTFNDVTARTQLEAQLEQAHRLTSLGRLAATIAHEFNNVLMGISPFVELLRRSDQSPERRLDCLEHISKSVKRGKRITEEILRFTNPAEPVLDAVDVMTWSDAFALEARSILGVRHTLAVHLTTPGVKVLADAGQLHQIVMNLVLNARDAMPNGGVVALSMGIEQREPAELRYGVVRDPGSHLHIAVEDHGCGMPPETLRHIFEPLFTTKRTGTGLGLAVTHQVVMRHGGQLFVESTPDVGTTFHIFLPLAGQPLEPRRPRRNPARRPPAIRRVLLVEDEPAVASGLCRLLEAEGMEVSVVCEGAAVAAAIERLAPDVVVLDIGLPDMEGTQVYARIADRFPGLPVLFSTGHGGDEQNIEQFLSRPNVGLLMKPYDVRKLMEALETVSS
ncbi:MAG TPA: PAS domain S-box protein [Thermoanaerobaculia bacterium]|jgi:PAS domain S-box-containing protein|nr:PAS domain S-box protein [Thermoanaerobaculia bacterium]